VVVAAPYGAPSHIFPAPEQVAEQLVAWTAERAARGHVLLLVSDELKALDVAAVLFAAGIAACAPPSIRTLAKRARAMKPAVPELRPLLRDRPSVVIALTSQRGRLTAELAKLPLAPTPPLATAWVSGEAIDAAAVSARAVDRGFACSSCADRTQLLAWIEATSARQIYLTGKYAPEIVAHLGKRASVLGPPLQMRLFTSE
jgi:hypothetical protein